MAETARSLLPLAERFGVATTVEVDVDTLEDRLHAETFASGGVMIPAQFAAARARTP